MEGSDSIYTEKTADELIALVNSAPTYARQWDAIKLITHWPGIETLNILPKLISHVRHINVLALADCVFESRNTVLLRSMLNLGLAPLAIYPGDLKCLRIMIDYNDSIYRERCIDCSDAMKFSASRKRARLGAIAVISAISRRRRRGAAAEGGITPYSKDVALIIARVVWESRGFYSFVSRRHFARRK